MEDNKGLDNGNTQICSIFFDKGVKATEWREKFFKKQRCCSNWIYIGKKKMNFNLNLTFYIEMKSKWITELDVQQNNF